jgi:hypothetical protein
MVSVAGMHIFFTLGVVTQTGKMRHVMKALLSTPQALSLE